MKEHNSDLKTVNLSSHILTKDEITVLGLGLNFCPTPSFDKFKAAKDIILFARKLTLHTVYDKTPTPQAQKAKDMELWKEFTIRDFKALKDLMQLWEEGNTDESTTSNEIDDTSMEMIKDLIPEYKLSLQRNLHIWSFVQKAIYDLRHLPIDTNSDSNLSPQ